MTTYNRRRFLKNSAMAAATIASIGSLGGLLLRSARAADKKAKEVPLPAGAVEVTSADPVAAAVGYVPKASDADKKKFPQYKKGQDCSSCALYTKTNEGWGKCQIITAGLVKSGGWCGSYNKKPA